MNERITTLTVNPNGKQANKQASKQAKKKKKDLLIELLKRRLGITNRFLPSFSHNHRKSIYTPFMK